MMRGQAPKYFSQNRHCSHCQNNFGNAFPLETIPDRFGAVVFNAHLNWSARSSPNLLHEPWLLSTGKLGILTTHGSKTPEPMATKLGVNNYVGDLNGQRPNMGAIGLCGWSGRMREISLFVTFFSFCFFLFLHLTCRSPRLIDFDDLYVKMRKWHELHNNE